MVCALTIQQFTAYVIHERKTGSRAGVRSVCQFERGKLRFQSRCSFSLFFLFNNMKGWCFFKYMNFHISSHCLLRFKDIRCTWISWSFEIFLYAVTCYLTLLGFNYLIEVWWLQILSLRLLLFKADWSL